jgi:hypothetical protein
VAASVRTLDSPSPAQIDRSPSRIVKTHADLVAGAIKAQSLALVDVRMPDRRFFAIRHSERYITQAEREFYGLVRSRGG